MVTVGRGRRIAALTGAAVLAAALVVAALWHTLEPLTQQTRLAGAAHWTAQGLPVPASGHRCQDPAAATPGTERWCVPDGVSVATLTAWYGRTLPAGRDARGLRWCMEQRLSDGGRRDLWYRPGGLRGYELPAPAWHPVVGDSGPVSVVLVSLPDSVCPAVTRAVRESR